MYLATDEDGVFFDEEPTAKHVEAVDSEPDRFAPADAGVREDVDHHGIISGVVGEQFDLLWCQVCTSLLAFPRELHAAGRAEARAFMARLGADTIRPKVAETPVALMRIQQKWEQTKQLLEKGRDIGPIIRTADIDTLLAIEEFAPTYLQSRTAPKKGIGDVLAGTVDEAPNLKGAIERRLAEISSPEVAAALNEAQAAEQDLAAAAPYLEHVATFGANGASSRSMLDLAIEARLSAPPAPDGELAEAQGEPAVA